MNEINHIRQELDDLWKHIEGIKDTQTAYVNEHHNLEKELVEMKTDLRYIRKSQGAMTTGINKVLFIVGGGFLAAIVSFIIGGGLLR